MNCILASNIVKILISYYSSWFYQKKKCSKIYFTKDIRKREGKHNAYKQDINFINKTICETNSKKKRKKKRGNLKR